MPPTTTRRVTLALAAALTVLALAACSGRAPAQAERGGERVPRPAPTAATTAPPASGPTPTGGAGSTRRGEGAPVVTMVLAISVDGLAPEALRSLTPSLAPNFWRLVDEGATTLNARTEVEQTVTLPNHAGMLTGRRVDAGRGGHGYRADVDNGGRIVGPGGAPVPSIFDVVHAHGLSSALFASKDKFVLFDRSWPAIDSFVVDTDDTRLAAAAADDLREEHRAFTFLHLSSPDRVGHAAGWMSPLYLRAVADVDVILGDLLETIDETTYLHDHLVLLLTADHGGAGSGHSDARDPDDYTVPFLVRGPGVAAGADLYDLDPRRRDPGDARVGYGANRQPVRNGDLANLAAQLLGLDPVPASELGVTDPLRVLR